MTAGKGGGKYLYMIMQHLKCVYSRFLDSRLYCVNRRKDLCAVCCS